MRKSSIPGINTPPTTDLPVLKPFKARAAGEADDLLFSRWLAGIPGSAWADRRLHPGLRADLGAGRQWL